MTHFKQVCEYGATHSQCRCASPNKEVRQIKCTMPDYHSPKDEPADTSHVLKLTRVELEVLHALVDDAMFWGTITDLGLRGHVVAIYEKVQEQI